MEKRKTIESIQNTVRIVKCMIQWCFHSSEWQLPLLAHPGPANDAIHWALLSLLISSSCLIATTLLPAASLAAGVINPTLASKHIAWALTAVVEINRRY